MIRRRSRATRGSRIVRRTKRDSGWQNTGEEGRSGFPDSIKDEMRAMGLGELRRRGIGQHTIEKALHSTVRIKSYRKILAVIEVHNRRTRSETKRQAA